jgi:hypothetical protein
VAYRYQKSELNPWFVVYHGDREIAEVSDWQALVWNDPADLSHRERTARLFAASPDLATALSNLVDEIDVRRLGHTVDLTAAHAALALARGESVA